MKKTKRKNKHATVDLEQIGRCAFRQEGGRWVAYYAHNDSMEGAVELGSLNLSLVQYNPELKNDFMKMMRDLVGAIIRVNFGDKVADEIEWKQKPAPEHEKSGNA